MDRFLPWIGIAAGVIAFILAGSKDAAGGARPTTPVIFSALALVLVYAVAFIFRSAVPGLDQIAHGAAIGTAGVLIAYFAESRTGRSGLVAVGMATLVTSLILLLPAELRQNSLLGSVIGSGLAAACTSIAATTAGGDRLAAFAIAALSGSSVLGAFREGVERAAPFITLLGIVAIIAVMITKVGAMPRWARLLIVAIVIIGAAKLIAVRYLFLGASFNVALGAVATAAVVAWILDGEDSRSHGQFSLCTLIWLAWSTVAFGLLQGLGLAITAVCALAFLVAAGSYRGLLAMSPVVALLFYRIFLEMYPTETRQIDVGQQYAVMGIVAGVVLPVALASWLSRASMRFDGMAKTSLALLAGITVVAMLVAADFILGTKGTVGILIGLSLAPFVAALSGGERLGVLAAVGALAAAVVVTFRFVAPHLLLERAEKMQFLGLSIAIAIVLIAIAHWLTKEKPENEIAS